MIEFEITESMLMSNMRKSITMLKKLRAQGIQIALDDFGTGYSSLTYLKHFPVNSLKIDRSFLQDVTTDPDDAAIVKGIIALAHSMQIKVIAEGIEQDDQLQFLKTAGCDDGQGYLFAPGQAVDIFTCNFIKKKPDHIFNLTNQDNHINLVKLVE
jgi:EAL domain-containing protein (putative c-di-GMP-specific phosphodiesterase class I)